MGKQPQRLDSRFDSDDVRRLVRAWQKECGARVALRRELFGITRRELADLAGTTEPTILRIEAGTVNPRDHLRLTLACVLRCEVSTLWPYPTCEQVHNAAQAVT